MRKLIFLVLIVVFLGAIRLNSALFGNELEDAYVYDDDRNKRVTSNATIESLIVDGGGAFLQSAADFNRLISIYELSENYGADFSELRLSINAAITNLEKAKVIYVELKERATETPYNQDTMTKLRHFDYYAFRQSNMLIPSVFNQVWYYLSWGNIDGILQEFYSRSTDILDELFTLKHDIQNDILPDVANIWRVNQMYAKSKMFGQYVAQVFYNL
ncbi:MAG: hypothetical protein GY757_09895 [bacterium]|nr:hypothetical protein [bacterium]